MYCDIPKFARCCFCFPLRYGILAFAYVNLIISILVLVMTCVHVYYINNSNDMETLELYHGIFLYVHVSVPLTLNIIEIIFTVLLIVGAHLKNGTYIKVYFWYTVATVGASLVMLLLLIGDDWYYKIMNGLPLMLLSLVLHIYLLLIIWSEVKKLQNSEILRFERNTDLQNPISPVTEMA